MSWKAIDFLRAHTAPGARVFEWGGGGSTLFFTSRGCDVTTVESSEAWQEAILRRHRSSGSPGSLDVRHIPAETGDPTAVSNYVQAVHDGAPWNIIVIDGLEQSDLSRVACAREAARAVVRGGFVILDDSYRSAYAEIPRLFQGYERRIFRGLGSARLGVTQTDLYFARKSSQ